MLPAAPPVDETERLAALHSIRILDTLPEERFNVIVDCAARMFDVPIVAISLVDEHRLWFKARVGLDMTEAARSASFCGHAIHGNDTLVVEDARQDARFADVPLVTGTPGIRFYAGAPLISPRGHVVGTLCILDVAPRKLDGPRLELLHALRNLAAGELWVAEGSSVLQPLMPSLSAPAISTC